MTHRSSRARRLTAVAVAALSVVGGLATSAPPAAALSGPVQCPAVLPTAEAVEGLTGTGYTVERGSTPQPFSAEVLGRVKDGIAPGVDAIMAELDSPALRRAGGVWSGMSGSPVYAGDGRLIGAVSFGLASGPSRIAGITPGEDVKALLAEPSGSAVAATRVALSSEAARRLAARSTVSAAQARGGFTRLPIPLSVSGVSASARPLLERLARRVPGARVLTGGAGSAVGADAPPSTISAGGNLVAAFSTGDLTLSAIGTTTLVCQGRVVGFGHPVRLAGEVAYTLHPARAVYVQPDPVAAPFKVANPGGVAGTVDLDRLTGIRGRFGDGPPTTLVRTSFSRPGVPTRTSRTLVSDRALTPEVAAMQTFQDVVLALRRVGGGSARTTLTVHGTRAGGRPFALTRVTRLADPDDLAMTVAADTHQTLSTLVSQPYEKVTLTAVTVTGALDPVFRQLRITAVSVQQGGRYVRVGQAPVTARAGRALPVRVTLTGYQGQTPRRVVDLSLPVAARTAGRSGALTVSAGAESDSAMSLGPEEQLEPGPPGTPGSAVARPAPDSSGEDEAGSLDAILAGLVEPGTSQVRVGLQVAGSPVRTAKAFTGHAVVPYAREIGVRVTP